MAQYLDLLPISFFVIFLTWRVIDGADLGRASIDAFLAWAALSVISAEVLTAFFQIDFVSVLLIWGSAVALAARPWRLSTFHIRTKWVIEIQLSHILMITFMLWIGSITLVIALTSVSNNWDSLTYHLPRIEHWIQNHSLTHYPTAIERQNVYGPLSEIMLLPMRILSGDDALYLLLQWMCMGVSAAAVARIVLQLNGVPNQALFAAFFVFTLPIGILESTTTQNDYVVAAMLASFVSLGLESRETPMQISTIEAIAAALLSGLVKPIGYLLGCGFALWFTIEIARRVKFRQLIWLFAIVIVQAAVLVGPYAARNLASYGSLQSDLFKHNRLGSFGVQQTIDIAILNATLNFRTGNAEVDDFIYYDIVEPIASTFGFDRFRNDTLERGSKLPHYLSWESLLNEDFGPSLLHFIALLIGVAVSVARKKYLGYILAWALGVIVYCSVIRWNTYGVRYQLPIFILIAPIVSLTLLTHDGRAFFRQLLIVLLLGTGSLDFLHHSERRPILATANKKSYLQRSHEEQLFLANEQWLESYQKTVDYISASRKTEIALMIRSNDWEYPFWRMLRERKADYGLRIEHVGNTVIKNYPLGSFNPEIVVAVNDQDKIVVGDTAFQRRADFGFLSVYTPFNK